MVFCEGPWVRIWSKRSLSFPIVQFLSFRIFDLITTTILDWQRPDIIFTDISMPKMDGKEAARRIRRIEVSREADGAFAVVDVDTLWRDHDGNDFHWVGRACKIYSKCEGSWKLIAHTGLLQYPED